MVLSPRERYALIATIAAVAIFLGDRYVLSPILAYQARLDARQQNLTAQLEQSASLIKRRKVAEARWKEMTSGGLKTDAGETESALWKAISEWAQDAGLNLSVVRPERAAQKTRAREVAFLVTGNGPMSAVSRFLYRLQTTGLPVKAVEMQIGARREGADDLTLQLRLSALYLPTETKPAAKAPAPAAKETKP